MKIAPTCWECENGDSRVESDSNAVRMKDCCQSFGCEVPAAEPT